MSADSDLSGANSASDALPVDLAKRRKARLSLVLLFVAFLSPVVLAYVLYFFGQEWAPSGRSNNGELIVPARPLQLPELRLADHSLAPVSYFRHQWTLLSLGSADCAEPCQKTLGVMRSARLLTGREIDRVSYMYLAALGTGEGEDWNTEPEWLAHYPRLKLAYSEQAKALVDAFRVGSETDAQVMGRVYLVDPLGNLMMRYGPKDDGLLIFKDLRHLLKVSAVR